MIILRKTISIVVALIVVMACEVFAQQKGKATFYSKRATGARTASGVRLNNDSLVCAHRSHPFGTLLLVKNPANGKEVVVKVIDRGPFAKGRIIDLSWEAANRLGIISKGVAAVEVSVYHNEKGIPYASEPDEIPELQLEVTEPMEGMTPAWQKSATSKPRAEDAIQENVVEDKIQQPKQSDSCEVKNQQTAKVVKKEKKTSTRKKKGNVVKKKASARKKNSSSKRKKRK